MKKRVERDRDDSSYVITTYEGVHNHWDSLYQLLQSNISSCLPSHLVLFHHQCMSIYYLEMKINYYFLWIYFAHESINHNHSNNNIHLLTCFKLYLSVSCSQPINHHTFYVIFLLAILIKWTNTHNCFQEKCILILNYKTTKDKTYFYIWTKNTSIDNIK